MARNSYLKRQDVQYPQQANPRDTYGVKLIENTSLPALQLAVNSFLFTLPEQAQGLWVPHVLSVDYDNYTVPKDPPNDEYVVHVAKITLYIVGQLDTPFSGN